jgi:hypothetical protein
MGSSYSRLTIPCYGSANKVFQRSSGKLQKLSKKLDMYLFDMYNTSKRGIGKGGYGPGKDD